MAALDGQRLWLTRRREGRVEDRLAHIGEVALYDDGRDVGKRAILKSTATAGEIIGRYAADRFERWWVLWTATSGPIATTHTEDELLFPDVPGK